MTRVCVVGAGAVGLTTATLLQDAIPSASVTLIADQFLQDTVSNVAAGIFHPGMHFQGPNREITEKWLRDSYDYYKKILKTNNASEAGLMFVEGYEFSNKSPKFVENSVMGPIVEVYRPCTREELERHGMKYGSYGVTILAECPRFLPYLMRKFRQQGGQIIERQLGTLEDLADDYDVVCNCSGLGAKDLVGDPFVTPMRGQVFKVKAPGVKHFYFVDQDTYIIPGFDFITLGGTRQFGSYNADVCKHDSAGIWERCTEFLPELKNAEVLRECVGFRPYRGTVRVEKEHMTFGSGKKLEVVHNYGHGGWGIMAGPGTSMYAVSLVREILGHKSKL